MPPRARPRDGGSDHHRGAPRTNSARVDDRGYRPYEGLSRRPHRDAAITRIASCGSMKHNGMATPWPGK